MPHTKSITMAVTYIFLYYNCILVCEMFFDRWGHSNLTISVLTKDFTLYSIYRSNCQYAKFTVLHKLISIVLLLTNQIK